MTVITQKAIRTPIAVKENIFFVGNLVELDDETSQPEGDKYVVMVVKEHGTGSNDFVGVVVQNDGVTGTYVGELCKNFSKNAFQQFIGTIQLNASI
jgi:hypothetical protein